MTIIKRILAFLLDLVAIISMWGTSLIASIAILYLYTKDLAVLNDLLKTQLYGIIIFVYAMLGVVILIYSVIIPTFLKSTVGEFLFGFIYMPNTTQKPNFLRILVRNTVGAIWNVMAFPYNIFAIIKKRRQFVDFFSGLTLTAQPGRLKSRLGLVLSVVTGIFIMFFALTSVYLYQTGPFVAMEQFINHEKQVNLYLSKPSYAAAANSLEKYKKYNGETDSYFYYKCSIESHQDATEAILATCNTALDKNSSNKDRKVELLGIKADLLRGLEKNAEALTVYADLWTNYSIRTFDMVNYIYLINDSGKPDEAFAKLEELYKSLTQSGKVESVQKLFFADIYYNLKKYDGALVIINELIDNKEADGLNQASLGDTYFKQGENLYYKNDLTGAKTAFTKAKENNPDLTDSAETYLNDISFKLKKK